jgi:acyl carrier protein
MGTPDAALKRSLSQFAPMEQNDIARRICLVFVKSLDLNLDPDDPSFPNDLSSVAGLDSLSLLEFIAGLEAEFQFKMEPEKFTLEFLSDLNALSDYIAEQTGQD